MVTLQFNSWLAAASGTRSIRNTILRMNCFDYCINDVGSNFFLSLETKLFEEPIFSDHGDLVGVVTETRSLVFEGIEDYEVKVLRLELGVCVCDLIACLQREAD